MGVGGPRLSQPSWGSPTRSLLFSLAFWTLKELSRKPESNVIVSLRAVERSPTAGNGLRDAHRLWAQQLLGKLCCPCL